MKKYLIVIAAILLNTVLLAQNKNIDPGAVWPDSNGDHIQAHGGGIIKIKIRITGMAKNGEKGWIPIIATLAVIPHPI
jgi:hypothetical protein